MLSLVRLARYRSRRSHEEQESSYVEARGGGGDADNLKFLKWYQILRQNMQF